MFDGIAAVALIFLAPLALIAAGVALWVNRPQRNSELHTGVLPLFGSDMGRALDKDVDDDIVLAAPLRAADVAPRSRTAGLDAFAPPVTSAARATPSSAPASAAVPSALTPPRPPAADRVAAPNATGYASPMSASPLSAPPMSAPLQAARRAPNASVPNGATNGASPNGATPNGATPNGRVPATAQRATARATAQDAWADGQAVRFNVPIDGTLQFLPGRLEIVSGQEPGREIRFVRLPDASEPEITFGRNEGALYRHVQLRDATVSRQHARMRYRSGAWTLVNLSTTNPSLLNGRVLADGDEHVLADNDRVEMGEVVFRFRTR